LVVGWVKTLTVWLVLTTVVVLTFAAGLHQDAVELVVVLVEEVVLAAVADMAVLYEFLGVNTYSKDIKVYGKTIYY
jgi:hypothetical protein